MSATRLRPSHLAISAWPLTPVIDEANTAARPRHLDPPTGSANSPDEVPPAESDPDDATGVDAMRPIGVWERSKAGMRLAPRLARADDVVPACPSRPQAIGRDRLGVLHRRYEVDARFGGREALPAPAPPLAERGVRLLVDLVPNHVAPDHPWLTEHPEHFVQRTADDLAGEPDGFLPAAGTVITCGRDPRFKLPAARCSPTSSSAPHRQSAQTTTVRAVPARRPALIKELT
jgi:Alpha amylase, catalytic domain